MKCLVLQKHVVEFFHTLFRVFKAGRCSLRFQRSNFCLLGSAEVNSKQIVYKRVYSYCVNRGFTLNIYNVWRAKLNYCLDLLKMGDFVQGLVIVFSVNPQIRCVLFTSKPLLFKTFSLNYGPIFIVFHLWRWPSFNDILDVSGCRCSMIALYCQCFNIVDFFVLNCSDVSMNRIHSLRQNTLHGLSRLNELWVELLLSE